MKKLIFYRMMLLGITAMLLTFSVPASHMVCAKTNETAAMMGEVESEQTTIEDNKQNDTEKKDIVIQIGEENRTIKRLEGSFIEKKGIRYFKKENGKLAKSCFFAKGEKVYSVNSKGEVRRGWKEIKGHYYFFGRKTGKLLSDTTVDRIKITKKGIAKETALNVSIIKVYKKAQNVIQKVSNPADSKSQKLYKCFLWMKKFPYKRYRTMRTAKASHPNDWDVIFANDIFDRHAGCCASEASAFAYLAKACGYNNVKICSDTGHAWVDIGGKLYDPLFAESRSFSANYNANYHDYRINPAYTRKL